MVKPRRKGGRDYVRDLVRIRDNFTCQNCKKVLTFEEAKKQKKRVFDVHHLNGLCGKLSNAYDRKINMPGLITLCHKCHYNHHQFSQYKTYSEKRNIRSKIEDKKRKKFLGAKKKQQENSLKRKQIFEQLHSKGLSFREIGKISNLSRQRVHQIISKTIENYPQTF